MADGFDVDITQYSLDALFICVVLHEIDNKIGFLTQYKTKLKPGGHIYIVEFSSSRRLLNDTHTKGRIFISPSATEALIENCGYVNVLTVPINDLIYLTSASK